MDIELTPTSARAYIANFAKHIVPGTTFVKFADGDQVDFDTMTDTDAIRVARGLMDMEAGAARRSKAKGHRPS